MPVTRFPARARGPADRMADFVAHLRLNGLRVGVAETATAIEALGHVQATDVEEARIALRAVCAGRHEEIERFDALFDAYWLNRGRQRSALGKAPFQPNMHNSLPHLPADAGAAGGAGRPDAPDGGEGESEAGGEGKLAAVRMTNLARTDLRELVRPEDIALAETVARRIASAIRDHRSRRLRADRRGRLLDLRRTARASVSTGGEPLRLYRRTRPERPARLVALCDVSGSMTIYARVFLAFLKGLMSADVTTDAYLFHTRLVRITEALRDGDALRSVARLSLMADGFGGGTRIGQALESFNRHHAARAVSGRTVVLILSDGYDTDPPDRIAAGLARLRRRGCRIVWLNPLKGWKGYAPVAAGMAAALPHLDLFAAANTLEALAALEPVFERL
jgi:uncharacterized protein with von Willebrand factor type A (vWA) domain